MFRPDGGRGDVRSKLSSTITCTQSTDSSHFSRRNSVDKELYTVFLHDTIGEEGYDRLRPFSYPQTDVFLICFDSDKLRTLARLTEEWIPEVDFHAPGTAIVIVGFHADIRNGNLIVEDPADKKAKQELVCQEGLTVAQKLHKAKCRAEKKARKGKGQKRWGENWSQNSRL